jgi:2-hydroxy-4-carboxymuconate semialdehyde hemiacetal dehydrogenase
MTKPVRIALVGAGAFGTKHLDALSAIDEAVVGSVVSRPIEQAKEVASRYGVSRVDAELTDVLARDDIDAVILATPTGLHAEQAVAALRAGKHVQVEISVSPEVGPTTCCGTTPHTRSICCVIRPGRRSRRPICCRARSIPNSASRWTCRSGSGRQGACCARSR